MSQIILNKGQFYKLKQYREDSMYIIVCPSKTTTLDENSYFNYIHSLFKVTGYGKRKKLYTYYSFSKIPITITIDRFCFDTIKPLTIKDCIQVNILLRQEKYIFNKKRNKLIKLR